MGPIIALLTMPQPDADAAVAACRVLQQLDIDGHLKGSFGVCSRTEILDTAMESGTAAEVLQAAEVPTLALPIS